MMQTAKSSKKGTMPAQVPIIPAETPEISETTEMAPVTAPSSTALTTTTTEQRAIEAAFGDAVATQTMPSSPNPRDLVGADVFYTLPHTGQRRPATITFDYETEGQLVDITVFTRGLPDYPEGTQGYNGVLPVSSISYAPATEKQPGTWHWKTEKA